MILKGLIKINGNTAKLGDRVFPGTDKVFVGNKQIVFENKDDLITFVDNIEQYIIQEKEDRILYTIDEVSYDIMQYDEKQSTKVSLTAYYFK